MRFKSARPFQGNRFFRPIRTARGFSLIELLITVAIIAIIASFALPAFDSVMERARRADGQAALADFATVMARYHTESGTYTGAAAGGGDTGAPRIYPTKIPIGSANPIYEFQIQDATDEGFTIRANAVGAQVDTGRLEITSLGQKFWDANNNGSTADLGEDRWD